MFNIVVASVLCVGIYSVSGQLCNTPTGSGNCVTIHNCASLLQLVRKPNKSAAEIDLLRKSACGFEQGLPKVCCPDSDSAAVQYKKCLTPYWEEGKCVDLNACPHIREMLKPPVSKENAEFVKKSVCQGPTQYSVCCGRGQPPEKGYCDSRQTAAPPDPRTHCCGVDAGGSNKIIGGTEVAIDQYPWLSLIEYFDGAKTHLLCGGALISSRYVLTAAHCLIGSALYGKPKNVRLGEHDTANAGEDCVAVEGGVGVLDCADPILIIPIERNILHDQYSPHTRKNDIGLIRLAEAAPFTDFIRPICLPMSDVTTTDLSGHQLWAAGWGNTNESRASSSNIKLHVDLPFVPTKDCQDLYAQSGRKWIIGPGQFCAGGVAKKDSCKGDSGGPLMFRQYRGAYGGGYYEVIGIVSIGPSPCGMEDIPSVYTKTYNYINWIRDNIEF